MAGINDSTMKTEKLPVKGFEKKMLNTVFHITESETEHVVYNAFSKYYH